MNRKKYILLKKEKRDKKERWGMRVIEKKR